jgi:hypothetical protein
MSPYFPYHIHFRSYLQDVGMLNIVTGRLKAGISESKQTSIVSQRQGKHCSRSEVRKDGHW